MSSAPRRPAVAIVSKRRASSSKTPVGGLDVDLVEFLQEIEEAHDPVALGAGVGDQVAQSASLLEHLETSQGVVQALPAVTVRFDRPEDGPHP